MKKLEEFTTENELDLVVFEDDNGNELTMEVLDYLFYEGKEYALLAEYDENSACESCEDGECEGCANQIDAFVMEVRPVEGDEETEEFVPVDEKLAEKLIEIFQNSAFDEEDIDAFEDEADDRSKVLHSRPFRAALFLYGRQRLAIINTDCALTVL